MKKINLIWLGAVMVFLLSMSAWADGCSSTNQLLVGESQTYNFCTEKEVISKGDIFSLGGVEWQYKGADKVTAELPKLKLKNLETSDTMEYWVKVVDNKAFFTLKYSGKSYAFESSSDINLNDYEIKLISGTVSSCVTYEVVPVLIGYDESLDERYVKFEVNGEKTSKLNEGDSYTLANGAVLSVNEILYQAYAGGVHAAWFCIDGEAGTWLKAGAESSAAAEAGLENGGTSPVSMEADLANYPDLFIKDGALNAYFVVGWEAPSIDNLAMTDIAVGLPVEVFDATKLDAEISDPLHNNLIVVGKTSDNTVANLLMGGVTSFLNEGEGMIKLFENNGYVQMLVTGYSPEDTRKAARVLMNYQDFNLQGTEIIVTGTKKNPQIETSEEPLETEPLEETEAEEESQPQPEPTPEAETPTEEKCNGCKVNGNCLPYGTRLVKEGKQVYCSIEGTLQEQQELNGFCQNNYECLSNQCSNAKCIDLSGQIEEAKSILERIFEWLKRIFG